MTKYDPGFMVSGVSKTLTVTQDKALRQIADSLGRGLDTTGIRARTFGALVGAGYITLRFGEVSYDVRPSRYGFSGVRNTRTCVEIVAVDLTPEGRAYLAAKE